MVRLWFSSTHWELTCVSGMTWPRDLPVVFPSFAMTNGDMGYQIVPRSLTQSAIAAATWLTCCNILTPQKRFSMAESKFEKGMNIRREVLGNAHVDRAEANKTAFDADFQRFITETAWGSVWSRPGLERKTRHLLTLAMLAALGKENELAMHIRATANTGVTAEELKEVFLQVAVYAGVPAANAAFAIAKKVYAELAEYTNTQEETK